MTDDTEIRPALTAEEWSDLLERYRKVVLYYSDPPHQAPPPDAIHNFALNETAFGVHNARAVAMLALHGQPFGFTREDVRTLRADGHSGADVYHPGEICCDSEAREARLRNIADRIEALLPPE